MHTGLKVYLRYKILRNFATNLVENHVLTQYQNSFTVELWAHHIKLHHLYVTVSKYIYRAHCVSERFPKSEVQGWAGTLNKSSKLGHRKDT